MNSINLFFNSQNLFPFLPSYATSPFSLVTLNQHSCEKASVEMRSSAFLIFYLKSPISAVSYSGLLGSVCFFCAQKIPWVWPRDPFAVSWAGTIVFALSWRPKTSSWLRTPLLCGFGRKLHVKNGAAVFRFPPTSNPKIVEHKPVVNKRARPTFRVVRWNKTSV